MRILVVYYSRSGTTRDLANAIAKELGADIEEIVDPTPREDRLGYLRSVFESVTEREAPIRPGARDPRDYDAIVVGTPVWVTNMSCPVRAYLGHSRGRLPEVAFFCTMKGAGHERTFHKMEMLSGAHPIATLALRQGAPWRQTQRAILDFTATIVASGSRGEHRDTTTPTSQAS